MAVSRVRRKPCAWVLAGPIDLAGRARHAQRLPIAAVLRFLVWLAPSVGARAFRVRIVGAVRYGEAANPGPQDDQALLLEFQNVGQSLGLLPHIRNSPAHVIGHVETHATIFAQQQAGLAWGTAGWNADWGAAVTQNTFSPTLTRLGPLAEARGSSGPR